MKDKNIKYGNPFETAFHINPNIDKLKEICDELKNTPSKNFKIITMGDNLEKY